MTVLTLLYYALSVKIKTLLIIALLVPVVMFGHDGHTAYYTFSGGDNAIDIEVRIDSAEFSEELRTHSVCPEESSLTVCGLNYIKKNLDVSINGDDVELQYVSSFTDGRYSVVLFGIIVDPIHVRTIAIHNTCFVFSKHATSNIVRFLFAEDVVYKLDQQNVDLYHEF